MILMQGNIMDNLDSLVKLASLGTAGVSILAIFILGVNLFKLPNDTSKEITSLISKYISVCAVIAAICAVSGIANAYFNRGKIIAAESNLEQVTKAYDVQVEKLNTEKQSINSALIALKGQITSSNKPPTSAVNKTFDSIQYKIGQLYLPPKDSLVNASRVRKTLIKH